MMRTHLGVALVAMVVATPVAKARSDRLWLEKDKAAPALATVPDFKSLAKQTLGAVVGIQVEKREHNRGQQEFFERFWGGPSPRQFRNRGLGSGFVIRNDGLILTNNHVVDNASSIEVSFLLADGSERTMTAEILGAAPQYDVALIKTDDIPEITAVPLGDSLTTEIGDWVMAIGNPFGLDHSVSVGIISAKGRRNVMPSGRQGLYDFIQTDAAINPGNSGGPLINMRGEVVGINTAINAAGTGIGFAIPVNMVKAMLPDLNEKGRYARSWIGIRIQPLNEALASSYGLTRTEGALISQVVPGGPAARSGLHEGDVVLEFDGKVIQQSSDLPLYASMAGVGKKVAVGIWRNEKRLELEITMSAFPSQQEKPLAQAPIEPSPKFGIVIKDITPQLRQRFNLNDVDGVVVVQVEEGSIAERSGVQPGDVIHGVNGRDITRARQFVEIAKRADQRLLRVKIGRGGGRMFIALGKPR